LLKLFFAAQATPAQVRQLARGQAAAHRARADEYVARRDELAETADEHVLATLELGARYETVAADFWDELERGKVTRSTSG
jgi:Virulence activator alpha C-term